MAQLTEFQIKLLRRLDEAGGQIFRDTLSGPENGAATRMLETGFCSRKFVAYKGFAVNITAAGRAAIRNLKAVP